MKKYLPLIMIFLLPLFFIKIPEYKELNNLIIIKTIEVKCDNNKYNVKLKEIIPEKNDTSIEYKYKNYEDEGDNLKEIKEKIEKKTNKKFYYRKTDYLITNCNNEKEIMKIFNIKEKRIKN